MPRTWMIVSFGVVAALGADRALAQSPSPKYRQVTHPIPNQYIVVLDAAVLPNVSHAVGIVAEALTRSYGGRILHQYESAIAGFSVAMGEVEARLLSGDPLVAWVEEDGEVYAGGTQANAPWALDRIDQTRLPLNDTYAYPLNGAGSTVYVLDSGIRVTHLEFGVPSRAVGGFTAIQDGHGTDDCNGHGTHVAAIIGGATYGVAKSVHLIAVRVLDCNNQGAWSGVISGIDWVTANHTGNAVANMSLWGDANTSVDTAVQNSIAAGVTYVVIAGNDNGGDACLHSPARVGPALTVAATDGSDFVASFSNQGTCVDLFGPGVAVTSAYNSSDTATAVMSGTSMAAPHVAGVAAMYLQGHPNASPGTTATAIVGNGNASVLSGVTAGSPNLLLSDTFVSCQVGLAMCADVCCAGISNGYPVCLNNQCGVACNAGYSLCSGQCVNLSTDTTNCGACGTICPGVSNGFPVCSAGSCTIGCNYPYHDCGDGRCITQLCP